jgi:hypothetical protein
MYRKTHISVYEQLIYTVRSGFNTLNGDARKQISVFVESRLDRNGGFTDRSGNPDFYYSLFGFWLSTALNLGHLTEKHKIFIKASLINKPQGIADQLALIMISANLFPDDKSLSVLKVIKEMYRKRRNINQSYSFFLLMLRSDAKGKYKGIFNFFAYIWLLVYKPSGNIPCSVMASNLLIKKRLGSRLMKVQKRLLSYLKDGSGFKAFTNIENADMLSTAVALFALKRSGSDLRIIKPDCLCFIEQNFDSGAFLPGNGDTVRDLEYTFYGLLALGSLESDDEY